MDSFNKEWPQSKHSRWGVSMDGQCRPTASSPHFPKWLCLEFAVQAGVGPSLSVSSDLHRVCNCHLHLATRSLKEHSLLRILEDHVPIDFLNSPDITPVIYGLGHGSTWPKHILPSQIFLSVQNKHACQKLQTHSSNLLTLIKDKDTFRTTSFL